MIVRQHILMPFVLIADRSLRAFSRPLLYAVTIIAQYDAANRLIQLTQRHHDLLGTIVGPAHWRCLLGRLRDIWLDVRRRENAADPNRSGQAALVFGLLLANRFALWALAEGVIAFCASLGPTGTEETWWPWVLHALVSVGIGELD